MGVSEGSQVSGVALPVVSLLSVSFPRFRRLNVNYRRRARIGPPRYNTDVNYDKPQLNGQLTESKWCRI